MPQVGKLSLNPSLVSGSVCSIFLHKWPLLSSLSEALALSDTHCEAVNCRRRPLLGLAGAFSGHCEILRCTRQAWKLKHYTTLWWRHQSSVQCVLGILQRPALRSQCIHRALQVKFQPGKYPKRRWVAALCREALPPLFFLSESDFICFRHPFDKHASAIFLHWPTAVKWRHWVTVDWGYCCSTHVRLGQCH